MENYIQLYFGAQRRSRAVYDKISGSSPCYEVLGISSERKAKMLLLTLLKPAKTRLSMKYLGQT